MSQRLNASYAAAVEAFGQRGYHATTTREIAERAGMSPAGMYIHFQSKQDILYQVSRRGHAAVLKVVEDALAGDAPPEEQVRRFVQAFTAWHAWNHRSARVQQYELHALAASTSRTSETCVHGSATCSRTSTRRAKRNVHH